MDVVDDILQHHGVKGMRWGVRKSTTGAPSRSERRAAKSLAKRDAKFETIGTKKNAQYEIKRLANNSIQPVVQSKVYQMNARPEYAKAIAEGRLKDPNDPVAKKYVNEYNKMYINTMNDYLKGYSNASGTRVARAYLNSSSFSGFDIRVENAQVKHADDSMIMRIKLIKDDKGRITGSEVSEDSMAQTSMLIGEVLEHHGVKGMRWGIRKDRSSNVSVSDKRKRLKTSGGHDLPAHPDAIRSRTIGQKGKASGTKALSDEELQAYTKRLNLEANFKRAQYADKNPAAKFVATLLGQTGKTQAGIVANEVAGQQVKKHITAKLVAAAAV